jgi:hypothetical protein
MERSAFMLTKRGISEVEDEFDRIKYRWLIYSTIRIQSRSSPIGAGARVTACT